MPLDTSGGGVGQCIDRHLPPPITMGTGRPMSCGSLGQNYTHTFSRYQRNNLSCELRRFIKAGSLRTTKNKRILDSLRDFRENYRSNILILQKKKKKGTENLKKLNCIFLQSYIMILFPEVFKKDGRGCHIVITTNKVQNQYLVSDGGLLPSLAQTFQ